MVVLVDLGAKCVYVVCGDVVVGGESVWYVLRALAV